MGASASSKRPTRNTILDNLMRKLLQIAFAINIFLNLTNLFVFIPAWLGLPLRLIGGLMLLVNLAYLFSERAVLADLLRHKLTWALLVLFFIWPLLGALFPMFNGYSMKREIVLQAFYATTLLGAGVYVLRVSYARARLLAYACFGVSIVGIFAQIFLPGFFMSVAMMAENSGEVFAFGRAAGFFVNPNVAGRFVILMYLLLMLSPKKLGALEILAVTTVAFAAVLLTASRSSLLLCMGVIFYVIGHRFSVPYISGRMTFSPGRFILGGMAIVVLAVMAAFILPLASKFVLEKTDVGSTKHASQRFDFFAYGFGGFVDRVEEEAVKRWYTVEPYVDGFKESWLFGRGLSGYRIYKTENHLALTPHNTIFAMWLNYGVFYVLFGFFCFFVVAVSPRMRLVENHLGMSFTPVLFLALLGIMFTYDGLFAQRGFYIMVGLFLGLYCAPVRWFDFDRNMSEAPLLRKSRRRRQ
jgi:hypothetical protein